MVLGVPPQPAPKFSEADVVNTIAETDFPFGDANEGVRTYLSYMPARFAVTLNLIDSLGLPRSTKVLELAAEPYGMTALLSRYCFDDLTLATLGSAQPPTDLNLVIAGAERSFSVHRFNVERDPWPFADQSFDFVISCEMIEHLLFDPMHVFAEANRCLRPGGRLLVTTPNSGCLQNVIKAMRFGTMGYAPFYRLPSTIEKLYERHNRELPPGALRILFESGGFAVDRVMTANMFKFDQYGLSTREVRKVQAMIGEPNLRGDTMMFVGTKKGPVVVRYPIEGQLYFPADLSQPH